MYDVKEGESLGLFCCFVCCLYYLFVCNTIYHFITVELRLLLYIASVSILYRLCGFVSFYTNDKNNILRGKEKVGKWVGKVGKVG